MELLAYALQSRSFESTRLYLINLSSLFLNQFDKKNLALKKFLYFADILSMKSCFLSFITILLSTTVYNLLSAKNVFASTIPLEMDIDCSSGFEYLFSKSSDHSIHSADPIQLNEAIRRYNEMVFKSNMNPQEKAKRVISFQVSNSLVRKPAAPAAVNNIIGENENLQQLEKLVVNLTADKDHIHKIFIPNIYIQRARVQTDEFLQFSQFFFHKVKNPNLQKKMNSVFSELASQRAEYIGDALDNLSTQIKENLPKIEHAHSDVLNAFRDRLAVEVRQLTRSGKSAQELLQEDLRVSILNQGLTYEEKRELDEILKSFYSRKNFASEVSVAIKVDTATVWQSFLDRMGYIANLPRYISQVH